MWDCADLIWSEWYFNRNELVSDRAAIKINYGPWNAMRTTRWSVQTWQPWQFYVKSCTFCPDELDEILTDPTRSDWHFSMLDISSCGMDTAFQRRSLILIQCSQTELSGFGFASPRWLGLVPGWFVQWPWWCSTKRRGETRDIRGEKMWKHGAAPCPRPLAPFPMSPKAQWWKRGGTMATMVHVFTNTYSGGHWSWLMCENQVFGLWIEGC